jgi:DNA replication protein DnaC
VRNWNGLEVYHPEIEAAIRAACAWYKAPVGGLVLAGGYGCGKTSLAKIVYRLGGGAATLIEWTEQGPVQFYPVTFYSEPDLLDDIRRSYGEAGETKIIKRCQKSDILILDDLGAGYVKEESRRWYEGIMWRLFDGREFRKTLVTTNLDPAELKLWLGGRCWSRLQEMLGGPDGFIGMFGVPDYRTRGW